jgi:hypothetical protein
MGKDDTYEVEATTERLKAKIEEIIESALAEEKPCGSEAANGMVVYVALKIQ